MKDKALRVLAQIEPNELKATITSTLIIFVLMTSYYAMRPVRDALASDWSDTEVSVLWNLNFVVSSVLVALLGLLVSRQRLRAIVPGVYGFFALLFVAFFAAASTIADRTLIDKAFYLWVSVYALFHVSVFWVLMADTFRPEQAKRLFGIVMAGSSAGALLGPAIPTVLAGRVPIETLMLVSVAGLILVVPLVFYLYRLKGAELGNVDLEADTSALVVGGRWWEGFRSFVSNPYLLGIGAFILLYVFVGSFVYFEQKKPVGRFFAR